MLKLLKIVLVFLRLKLKHTHGSLAPIDRSLDYRPHTQTERHTGQFENDLHEGLHVAAVTEYEVDTRHDVTAAATFLPGEARR